MDLHKVSKTLNLNTFFKRVFVNLYVSPSTDTTKQVMVTNGITNNIEKTVKNKTDIHINFQEFLNIFLWVKIACLNKSG